MSMGPGRYPRVTRYRTTKSIAGLGVSSGRPGPMARLPMGAYYVDPVNIPMGIGSYDAVGVTSSSQQVKTLGEQTLLEVLGSVQPAGPYTPWAERTGDLSWREVIPVTNRLLYPMEQADVEEAALKSGERVRVIGVLSAVPSAIVDIVSVFDDSKYELWKTEAVYAQSDDAASPGILFLHWGTERSISEWAGRDADEEQVADALQGQLVFPVEVAASPSDRPRPTGTFADALDQQFQPEQVQAAMAPLTEESPHAGVSFGQVLFYGAAAVGAGYLAYRWMKR